MEINEDPTQNYIKFKFDIKGSSGHLGTSVIADYLTHRELLILENERQDYMDQKAQIKAELQKHSKNKAKVAELTAKS